MVPQADRGVCRDACRRHRAPGIVWHAFACGLSRAPTEGRNTPGRSNAFAENEPNVLTASGLLAVRTAAMLTRRRDGQAEGTKSIRGPLRSPKWLDQAGIVESGRDCTGYNASEMTRTRPTISENTTRPIQSKRMKPASNMDRPADSNLLVSRLATGARGTSDGGSAGRTVEAAPSKPR